MQRAYVTAGSALRSHSANGLVAMLTSAEPAESVMTNLENRCSNCGGKFGLVSYHHWGLRFCRKACKDNFVAKTAKGYACLRRWFGFLPRGAA